MSDSDNEGQHQIADVPPAPDPSDEASKDASELQEAAAKKSETKQQRTCLGAGTQQQSTASSSRMRLPCKRKDGQRLYQLNSFLQEEGH
jgi:hypothetical protein